MITEKDKKLLWARSGNVCAFPGCEQRLTEGVSLDGLVVGQIAHIRGKKPRTARWDPNLNPQLIDSYDNLILLCPTHHTIVDKDESTHTLENLCKMKETHESMVNEKGSIITEFEGKVSVKSKDGDSATGARIIKPTRIKSGSSFTVETENVKKVTGLQIGGE